MIYMTLQHQRDETVPGPLATERPLYGQIGRVPPITARGAPLSADAAPFADNSRIAHCELRALPPAGAGNAIAKEDFI
jgi:hypothetical protein